MSLETFQITRREPYLNGRVFEGGGAYERIDGVATYAVDPEHAANAGIIDLPLAPRDANGRVRYSGDVTILRPLSGGNRTLLLEVPNRGNRVLQRNMNRAPFDLMPTDEIQAGDGFLQRHGWTLAWVGWQWDVPKPGPRMGLEAPRVLQSALNADAPLQLRIQPNQRRADYPLTDHHVGAIGNHQAIPAREGEEGEARLLVRDGIWGEASEIPRESWRFARNEDGITVADPGHIHLDGGFEPGKVYDILYTPAECPVPGIGLLALRDLGAWLKGDAASPIAGGVDHAIAQGISQCGRFLRSFIERGLNIDEAGGQVFDGILVHIAGGRRGEFNHRRGQPSVQPTPSFGHLFPFADTAQNDPRTGRTAGLLDRQRAKGGMAKIFYTDTSAEYWRGDASLAHLSVVDGGDVEPPADEVRRYLFASTQHSPGVLPFTDQSPFGTHGSNHFNVIDYRPLLRAALTNLHDWIRDGTAPPESVIPRQSDGTAATREAVAAKLAAIPALARPDPAALPWIYPLDLGELAERGIPTLPAMRNGPAYPCLVSDIDADGNEIAGIAMPDVSVAVATHTGFNVRHPASGGAGQILEYVGLTLPLAKDRATREAAGDPRPSIAERYANRDDYLRRVRAAAEDLVAQRHLLAEDVDVCAEIAAERYDACA